MPYAGKTLMAREIGQLCYEASWRYTNLAKMVATILAESSGSVGAWHDNERPMTELAKGDIVANVETLEPTEVLDPAAGRVRLSDGTVVTVPTTTEWVVSRDCGLGQINIPARKIGSSEEANLRTDSKDVNIYVPVSIANVEACRALYDSPWVRDGRKDIRRFQAWVAYTTGWATFPAWWVWKQTAGEPTGPWVATGRYIQKAIRGLANYHLMIKQDYTPTVALEFAQERQKQFKVSGELAYSERDAVYWKSFPAKPTESPADGVGPRPIPNDGS